MTRPIPVDNEIFFDGKPLISETDLKGNITYVNRKFVEMSGYSKEEAMGEPHNILRHPDMPREAFRQMWKTIQSGKIWEGYVKNLRKDGKFYWVIVNIMPKLDDNNETIGYIASRKVPKRIEIEAAEHSYKEMLSHE